MHLTNSILLCGRATSSFPAVQTREWGQHHDNSRIEHPTDEMKVDGGGVEGFRHRLSGELVCPGDQGYEAARAVWNGMIDRRPALIAYCANCQDVIEAVNFARRTGILTAVRSGGHNIAGASLCDGGLVIDLSRMNRVTVDPVSRTARAEGGAQLADLDTATQAHGLATTSGVNSDTGLNRANAGRRYRSARPQARPYLRQHVIGRGGHSGWAGAERFRA